MSPRLLLVAFVAAALLSSSLAAADPPARPPIDAAELSTLVKSGREVAGRTIPAAALLAAIAEPPDPGTRAQAISISSSDVIGPIDLTRRHIARAFVFRDTTFGDKVDLTGSSFHAPLTFSGKTRFARDASFSEATFAGPVTMEDDVVFDERFEAFRSNFMAETRFDRVTFKRRALFSESTFRAPVSFVAARFESGSSWSSYSQLFERVSFQDTADFSDATLDGTAVFDRSMFIKEAWFSGAKLDSARFADVMFNGKATFSGAAVKGSLLFRRASFAGDVYLDALNEGRPAGDRAGELGISESRALGRVHVASSRLEKVSFGQGGDRPGGSGGARAHNLFDKPVHMALLRCDSADFTASEFRDLLDLSGAAFGRSVSFARATFAGDVSLGGAELPGAAGGAGPRGVDLSRATFEKRLSLRFDQLVEAEPWYRVWAPPRLKLVTADAATWAALEQAFRASGDLESRNEAAYLQRLLAPPLPGEGALANKLSRVLWGYGLRPWRLVAWVLAFNALFALLYWTQTRPLAEGLPPPLGRRARLGFAFDFARRTAVSFTFGHRNARTLPFKLATLAHSIGAKLLFLFVLRAAVNASPLLHGVFGKLLG